MIYEQTYEWTNDQILAHLNTERKEGVYFHSIRN